MKAGAKKRGREEGEEERESGVGERWTGGGDEKECRGRGKRGKQRFSK